MSIISALPYTLQNGQVADATQVMANLNQIRNDVNNNAAPASDSTAYQAIAAAGTNRATATALISGWNKITAAATGSGLVLPSAVSSAVGSTVRIGGLINCADFPHIYALGSDTIDGVAGVTGILLNTGDGCNILCTSLGTWVKVQQL